VSEIVAAIVGALSTAAIAYIAFQYRAKIGSELTYFSAEAEGSSGILISPYASKHIGLTRVRLVNVGLRHLSNVELHLDRTNEVFSSSIVTSSVSENSIIVSPSEDYVSIKISEFPIAERIDVIIAQCGWPPMPGRSVRGAGGSYKVVDLKRYEVFKKSLGDMGWIFAALLAGYLIGRSANA
jgi:hypothetical protein